MSTLKPFVIGFGVLLGAGLFLTVPAVSTFLADRQRIRAGSFTAQILSWAYRPIEMIVETPPLDQMVSRETRHTVYSIVSRSEASR